MKLISFNAESRKQTLRDYGCWTLELERYLISMLSLHLAVGHPVIVLKMKMANWLAMNVPLNVQCSRNDEKGLFIVEVQPSFQTSRENEQEAAVCTS